MQFKRHIIRCKLGHFVERHQVFIHKLPVNLTEQLHLLFRRLPATLPSALRHQQGKLNLAATLSTEMFYSSCILLLWHRTI